MKRAFGICAHPCAGVQALACAAGVQPLTDPEPTTVKRRRLKPENPTQRNPRSFDFSIYGNRKIIHRFRRLTQIITRRAQSLRPLATSAR